MFMSHNKVYCEAPDFEIAVKDVAEMINDEKIYNDVHVIAPYRGGLPLGVRLSNQCKVPLSILDYQRLDGDSEIVSFMKNANINSSETLFLVDDIADEGITLNKCLEFLQKEFPGSKIVIYTIFGNNEKHNPKWKYTFKHEGNWIQFVPWEGF